nr:hypothetical protein [Paeniclostridium ghonii]
MNKQKDMNTNSKKLLNPLLERKILSMKIDTKINDPKNVKHKNK